MADTITACPRCNARSDAEARTMCRPHGDDCPMSVCEDWDEALAYMNKMAAWEPPTDEFREGTAP